MYKYIGLLIIIGLVTALLFFFGKQEGVIDEKKCFVIVGTNAEFAPFSFIENGQIKGFEIDMAAEVCKHLGLEMELVSGCKNSFHYLTRLFLSGFTFALSNLIQVAFALHVLPLIEKSGRK